tara:strand:+ start:5445 stop:6572 length:1128 start_codon:yes stop_codon:yes gene_type:complete
MAIQHKSLNRSQKSVKEDPNVVFRIGMLRAFTSNKQSNSTTLEMKNPKGGTFTMAEGWRVIERKFDTEKELKASCRVAPMNINVSRSRPNVVIKKGDIPNSTVDKTLEFLEKLTSLMINKNDPKQWDRFTEEAVGTNASAEWFFEDMRISRKQTVSTNESTIEIGVKLHGMKDSESKLRDALFLIGETPTKDDELEDLYFMLSNKVIDDPKSKSRQLFIKYFINPEMSDKELDIQKWMNKGLAFGIVEERSGFFVYGSERLGVSERDVIEFLGYSEDIFKALKVSVSNASGMKEDVKVANEVVEKVSDNADVSRAIAHISDKMKSTGLSSSPHMVLRGVDTLEDAVSKYNKKAKEADLPKSDYITKAGVLAEIGA